MKGARIAISSPHLLTVTYESYDNEMNDDLLGPSTLRPANAFICVEVILDGKRVGGRGAYMNVESQWTCKQVLRAYLQKHSPDNCPLPDSTKVIMQCTKQSDTIQGRAASDVGVVRDCSVFLDFPVYMAISEIPTKHFLFRCERAIEQRRPLVNAFTVILGSQNTGNNHLPRARARSVMNAQDNLYNDLRQFLKDHGVGFPADLAGSVGDSFLRHLSTSLFPLGLNVWNSLTNDRHNRVGPAPDPEFSVFFGRKALGHKADRPCFLTVVQNLQELWFGMGYLLEKDDNWKLFSPKLKTLSNAIQGYAKRVSSQAERQLNLITLDEPVRNVQTASNVAVVEVLPFHGVLPTNMRVLNKELQDNEVYVPMDVNPFMAGLSKWQRYAFCCC
jgi:hypothetical protein